jgi:hypothetical protein
MAARRGARGRRARDGARHGARHGARRERRRERRRAERCAAAAETARPAHAPVAVRARVARLAPLARLAPAARIALLALTTALLAAAAFVRPARVDAPLPAAVAAPVAASNAAASNAAASNAAAASAATAGAPAPPDPSRLAYAGHGRGGRPNYVRRAFTDDERRRLRAVFGIDDAGRLTLPDSGDDAVLRYDARPAGCAGGCPRYPARVGLASVREPGETWDAFAARVRHARRHDWQRAANRTYRTLAALDPEARAAFERLIADARRAGFTVRVQETYRSPERQALILSRGTGRTFTATSTHAYGRAADLVVDDGRIDRPATRRRWIAFRRWVRDYENGAFRLIGTIAGTWDWPHIEYRGATSGPIGYRTVEELLTAGARCEAEAGGDARRAAELCILRPHHPGGAGAGRLAQGGAQRGVAQRGAAQRSQRRGD